MELYITKRFESSDKFSPAHPTLPYMHIMTPEVVVAKDVITSSFYIASTNDVNLIGNLVKLKRVIAKHDFVPVDTNDKFSLTDDIIYIKPSPMMYYKNVDGTALVPCNRLVLDIPVKLQLSCDKRMITTYPKPYSSCNLYFQIDYVIVQNDFDFRVLNT